MQNYINQEVLDLIKLALHEDMHSNVSDGEDCVDITSVACIPYSLTSEAKIIARESGVIFGHDVAIEVCRFVDPKICYEPILKDGAVVSNLDTIALLTGPMRSILTAERVVLNFLQRLSAVSTATAKAIALVRPLNTRILDTRKTTPGYRNLEKAAIKIAGGTNHRQGLYDQFLIKNNHIDALGGDVKKAIQMCRNLDSSVFLKVEVRDRKEIDAAISELPNGLLLDNFLPGNLTVEVRRIRDDSRFKDITLEASGGINFDNLKSYAETGIDEISLGILTHSAKSMDLSLRFNKNI